MKKLYVASITPFDGNNQINDSAMRQLWDRNLAEGPMDFYWRKLRGMLPAVKGRAGTYL